MALRKYRVLLVEFGMPTADEIEVFYTEELANVFVAEYNERHVVDPSIQQAILIVMN